MKYTYRNLEEGNAKADVTNQIYLQDWLFWSDRNDTVIQYYNIMDFVKGILTGHSKMDFGTSDLKNSRQYY